MKFLFSTVCCFLIAGVFAQNKKIDVNAVMQQFPDAMAVWLDRKTDIELTWKNGEIKVQQKEFEDLLFTKDESSNFAGSNSVYFSYFYKLKNWDAFTLLPDGKKIKVTNSTTKSRSSFVFYDDSKEIEFLYPAISKGARGITNVDYELTDPHLLSPFYFENYFPTASAAIAITYPEELELNYLVKGNKDIVQVKKETKKGKTTLTFEAQNVAPVNFYGDAPPSSYFLTHVIFYIQKAKTTQGVMAPYLGTTKELAKHYYSNIADLDIAGGKEVKEVTDSLIKGLRTQEEKAKAIYKFVQQSVRYIAFEEGMGGFVPRNPELVCTRRYGDCKDKSALLVSMLRYAGLKAEFTWIGSRQLPYRYSEVPLPITDDHMICALELNGKTIFLDATDSYIPFETPASHIQGKEAFIVSSPDQFKIITVPTAEPGYSLFDDTTYLRIENKQLKGKIKIHTTGYETNDLLHRLESRTGKAREEYLQAYCYRGNNKVAIKNIKVEIDTLAHHAVITADFELPDYAKFLGNEVYINMNLLKIYTGQEIDFPKRKIPIEYDFKSTMRHVVVLDLADGYKVSEMPALKNYQNEVWGVQLSSKQADGKLYYTREFRNNNLYLYPDAFEKWNKVLENLFPVYKQSTVISK
ncbi:transglutaminase superfamily protein [Lacibacter cauensis]|uniref:Transglutaminase superfamily protein n=1 Tax=Lacibacter cauensis TaxID=510947 RepID=A0A562SAV6_9BACT|nr:transglutaminase domain-containing protein [Lacibacter cauensis]TWI78432.1 transglutaminase superfamily protein [Lacibacter cauensis]